MRTGARKQAQNEQAAVERLAHILTANFGADSGCLTMEYSPDGLEYLADCARKRGFSPENEGYMNATRTAAEGELSRLLRRVRYAMNGESLRYVAVTADLDDVTGERASIHHHAILQGPALEIAASKWTLGPVGKCLLCDTAYGAAQADFLLRQVRRVRDGKKYTRSRNLYEPAPALKDG